MDEDYIDLQKVWEDYFDDYMKWCNQNKVEPRVSDYEVWLEEHVFV